MDPISSFAKNSDASVAKRKYVALLPVSKHLHAWTLTGRPCGCPKGENSIFGIFSHLKSKYDFDVASGF